MFLKGNLKMIAVEQFKGQIDRLKAKLALARKADKDLQVFGASSHRYQIHDPLPPSEIIKFENQYQVKLPDCYKAFVCLLGNGGVSVQRSAAGPFYGIYPLGENIDELMFHDTNEHLKKPCILHPEMSDNYWNELKKFVNDDDVINEPSTKEIEKIFGGILPIGSQGCAFIHGIVLNGEFAGKVVNLDIDRQKPHFTYESNFLDWYERWLDEIIFGDLITRKPSWFGFTPRQSHIEFNIKDFPQ